jgi:hypothetical protein
MSYQDLASPILALLTPRSPCLGRPTVVVEAKHDMNSCRMWNEEYFSLKYSHSVKMYFPTSEAWFETFTNEIQILPYSSYWLKCIFVIFYDSRFHQRGRNSSRDENTYYYNASQLICSLLFRIFIKAGCMRVIDTHWYSSEDDVISYFVFQLRFLSFFSGFLSADPLSREHKTLSTPSAAGQFRVWWWEAALKSRFPLLDKCNAHWQGTDMRSVSLGRGSGRKQEIGV